MGKLLVELADEIPPVVVNPGRPQAIFLMKENFFLCHVRQFVPRGYYQTDA